MARLQHWDRTRCQFLDNVNVDILYKKAYCTCEVDGDYVLLLCHNAEQNQLRQQHRVHYSDWGNPTGASAAEVKSKIDVILASYASGAYFAAVYDNTTQTSGGTTVANAVTIGGNFQRDGITITGSQIEVSEDGMYMLHASLQFKKTSGADNDVRVWIRKNGTDVALSAREMHVNHNNGLFLFAYHFLLELQNTDYIEIYWQSDSANVQLENKAVGTTPDTPAVPSVIVNIFQLR